MGNGIMAKAKLSAWTDSKWVGSTCIVVGCIAFVLVALFLTMIIPSYIRSPNKANFTAGALQLKNVSSGLQQQISEKGSLKGIKSEDDVCHHILPGYKNPGDCFGIVKEMINEVCLKNSYSIKIIDEKHFEIRAQSNDKSQCRICVTESAVRPKTYDPGGECRKYSCIHE
jgi:hypothetical protein